MAELEVRARIPAETENRVSIVNSGHCWNCGKTGHWAKDCPLNIPAENVTAHRQRIDQITERFLNGEISPYDKRRLIKKEKELWNDQQKTAPRK